MGSNLLDAKPNPMVLAWHRIGGGGMTCGRQRCKSEDIWIACLGVELCHEHWDELCDDFGTDFRVHYPLKRGLKFENITVA